MAISYAIQAAVVDIKADSPNSKDVFFVDTNVWYWMTYPNAATGAFPGQLSDYPAFVNRVLAAGAKICHSGLSLAELSHLIEKTGREIYIKTTGDIKTKEYRHNLPGERSRVASDVEAAWGQVKSLSSPLVLTVDEKTTDASLDRFRTEKLDGYDLFILETMKNNGLVKIITDDGDFATVSGIEVFTANRNILLAARAQDKLLMRINNAP
ncbi:MAG: PIN domain-containing protein [Deltaproteobacteria bacterium]|nr:PIN domain-containing protein [Deltaproteobacteria bacterium]